MELSSEEARVLGSLMEKELATPQQYPLTLASLVAACNQATNRDPVVRYDDDEVTGAIDRLKQIRLVRSILPSHGRSAVRYRHVVDETLALDSAQRAILAVLLLRGPQTLGELRIRTDRMAEFDGLDAITHELEFLASREEPFVENIGRRPGQKEERWATLLVVAGAEDRTPSPAYGAPERRDVASSDDGWEGTPRSNGGVAGIAAELADLRREVDRLRQDLDELRSQLGE